MPKHVDLDKLVDELDEHYKTLGKKYGFDDMYVRGYGEAINDMEDKSEADVQEVKHGKWVERVKIRKDGEVRLVHWQCSLCGCFLGTNIANYCPNCGARMFEEEKNNEQN